jgi:hypothetical protein
VWRNEHRIGVTFVEGRIVPRPAQQSAGGALLIGGRRQQRPSIINFWNVCNIDQQRSVAMRHAGSMTASQ